MQYGRKEFMEVLNIGIQLSKEKDRNHLLNTIVNMCMKFTNCDAATLYLCENDALIFKIMKTNSQNINKGEKGEKIDKLLRNKKAVADDIMLMTLDKKGNTFIIPKGDEE